MEELEKTLGSSSSVGSTASVGNNANVQQTMLIDFESDLADASAPSNPTSPKPDRYDPFANNNNTSSAPSSTDNIFNMRNSSPPVLPPKTQNNSNDPFDFFNTPAQTNNTTNKVTLPIITFLSNTESAIT